MWHLETPVMPAAGYWRKRFSSVEKLRVLDPIQPELEEASQVIHLEDSPGHEISGKKEVEGEKKN